MSCQSTPTMLNSAYNGVVTKELTVANSMILMALPPNLMFKTASLKPRLMLKLKLEVIGKFYQEQLYMNKE